jgi:predicted GIY-YIG superfamily endonuclease
MTRMPINYQKTIIYKLVCNDVTIKELYVGHTTDFKSRKQAHNNSSNDNTKRKNNTYVYEFIRANGGWNNWEMIEIEKYPCKDSFEADSKKRYYIELYNATLNSVIPCKSSRDELEKQQLSRYNLLEKRKLEYEEFLHYKEKLKLNIC